MFAATYFILSGLFFYYLLKPPSTKKRIKKIIVDLPIEKPIPIRLIESYTPQEANSNV